MADKEYNPRWSLQTPPPQVDTSKWAKVELAKPIDPRLVIEAARAIRANPEIWSIFTSVKPDGWISGDDSGRIEEFLLAHFQGSKWDTGARLSISVTGMATALLRSHIAGSPSDLGDDVEVMNFLLAEFQSRVIGGGRGT